MEEDWNDRDKWKKKIIVKWAQKDIETSNNLLNKYIYIYIACVEKMTDTYILSGCTEGRRPFGRPWNRQDCLI